MPPIIASSRQARFNHNLWKNIRHSSENKDYVVNDGKLLEEFLSRYDRLVVGDPTENYGMLYKDWKPVQNES